MEQPTVTQKQKRPTKPKPQKPMETIENTRSAIDLSENISEEQAEAEDSKAPPMSDVPKIEESAETPAQPVETVPERILKLAEATKDEESGAKNEIKIAEIKEESATKNEQEQSQNSAEKTEKTV